MPRKGKPFAGFDNPKTGFARPGRRPIPPTKKYPGLVVDPGSLYIRTPEIPKPKLSITCLLGPTPPRVVEGYGGLTLVARNRRKSLVEFTGESPLLIQIMFLLDHWDDEYNTNAKGVGLKCEDEMRTIETMSGRGASGTKEPPRLLWDANAPHDTSANPSLLWMVESLEWDENPLRNDAGNIVRQGGTLQIREWVGDEFLSTAAEVAKTNAKNNAHHGGGTYKVRKGDTLQNIARQKLGNANKWHLIYKLNKKKIKHIRHLVPGTILKIPKI